MSEINLNKQLQTPAHPLDKEQWSTLDDSQKAKLLLGSERMLDIENFLHEFTSLEQPDCIYNQGTNKSTNPVFES